MNFILQFLRLIAVFILLQLSNFAQAAQVAPASTEWAQIDTKHFNVIYDKTQQDLGLYYADIAEQAYSNLNSIFSTLPEKITLVVNDNTDTSNGNATVFPYPLIFAYPVQVGTLDTLSESGAWAKELVTHELTHIAQLYPYSNSGYKIARALFGSIISPNLLTPLWWKEGMAVEMETQFSDKGRTRSYMQDAQVRSYVTENIHKNFDLAQANEALVTWPYGNRPYFFGSMIMSQISKDHKISAIGQITLEQSMLPPYFTNTPLEIASGTNYSLIYDKAQAEYTTNSTKQITELNKLKIIMPEKIQPDLLQSKSVQYNPQYNLLGLVGTTDMKTEIQFFQKDTTTGLLSKLILDHSPAGSVNQFNFHPTQKKIIYSKTHQTSLHQNFSDLYTYDIEKDKTEPLTNKERARDPVYSLNGEFALFLSIDSGKTVLKQIEMKTKLISTLKKVDFNYRINSYAYFSQDDVLYTIRNPEGDQKLYKINLKSLESILISSPKQIRFIKNINNKIYFNSTENEVQNVYSADFDQKFLLRIKPVTHVMTGVLNFDIDEKNKIVFATLIGANGPYTAMMPFVNPEIALPKITNEILSRYEKKSDLPYDQTKNQTEYSSLDYIFPKYWIPFVSNNITGNGILYQAMTSASDPLGFNSYIAQLNYDSFSQKPGYLLSYTNSYFDVSWNISAFQNQQLFGINNYVRKNIYSISIFPNTFLMSEDIRFSLGAIIPQTEDTFKSTNHIGGFIQATINNADQKSNHYYPMSGYNLIAKYSAFTDQNNQSNPKYGNYSQALLSLTSYNHLFLPQDHTIMFKLDGLYTFEDVASRFGTSNLSLSTESESQPLYLIRGYTAGQFLGTQIGSANLEYRFPILNIFSGSGTTPFYIKHLTAAVVADALALKGFGYDMNSNYQSLTLNEPVYSTGVEARLSTSIGYVLPLNFIFGIYYPMSKKFTNDKFTSALNIQFGGF